MITRDRPSGRAASRRAQEAPGWSPPDRDRTRRVAARRLTRFLSFAAGAGVALPLLLTWVRTSSPTGEQVPWLLVLLSWGWVGLLGLAALIVAVWTAPVRSAPPGSLTAAMARGLRLHQQAPAGPSRRDPSAARGPRVVALLAGLAAIGLVVLALL